MFGAIVALALSQCPGGQCYAPTAQPVAVAVAAPAYVRTYPAYYRTSAPAYYRTSPRVVRGYAYTCTAQGCYRR